MSRRNSAEAKAARRKARLESPLPPTRMIHISCCVSCGDYTHIYLPANYCSRCLDELDS